MARPASPPPGAGRILRYSDDVELVCAGFWPGDPRTSYPAFFAYGYPRPRGIEFDRPRPDAARWVEEAGLFLLPYEAVRLTSNPTGAILEFLTSTYEACATRLGWSTDLISPPGPTT